MNIEAALLVLVIILFLARKPIARAAKRYANKKKAQLKKWAARQARRAWVAIQLKLAKLTIGLRGAGPGSTARDLARLGGRA